MNTEFTLKTDKPQQDITFDELMSQIPGGFTEREYYPKFPEYKDIDWNTPIPNLSYVPKENLKVIIDPELGYEVKRDLNLNYLEKNEYNPWPRVQPEPEVEHYTDENIILFSQDIDVDKLTEDQFHRRLNHFKENCSSSEQFKEIDEKFKKAYEELGDKPKQMHPRARRFPGVEDSVIDNVDENCIYHGFLDYDFNVKFVEFTPEALIEPEGHNPWKTTGREEVDFWRDRYQNKIIPSVSPLTGKRYPFWINGECCWDFKTEDELRRMWLETNHYNDLEFHKKIMKESGVIRPNWSYNEEDHKKPWEFSMDEIEQSEVEFVQEYLAYEEEIKDAKERFKQTKREFQLRGVNVRLCMKACKTISKERKKDVAQERELERIQGHIQNNISLYSSIIRVLNGDTENTFDTKVNVG